LAYCVDIGNNSTFILHVTLSLGKLRGLSPFVMLSSDPPLFKQIFFCVAQASDMKLAKAHRIAVYQRKNP
jgi:hypothetical protein